jgi:hypothetical protein
MTFDTLAKSLHSRPSPEDGGGVYGFAEVRLSQLEQIAGSHPAMTVTGKWVTLELSVDDGTATLFAVLGEDRILRAGKIRLRKTKRKSN